MVGKGNRRGRPVEHEITDVQLDALREVADFIQEFGHAPTMRELAEKLGITSTGAHNLMKQLQRKGYVQMVPRISRSLQIIRMPEATALESHDWIPILGHIAAGPLMFAEENWLGRMRIDKKINRHGEYFALRVSGDSMIDAGIRDRDVVKIKRQPLAENGDIVVALIDGESTLKRLSISRAGIELHAANKNYAPIVVSADSDFRVLGIVVDL